MDSTNTKIYNEEISSTSTEIKPMVIDREEEPATSSDPSAKEFKSKIWVKDLREMMDADKYKKRICHSENCNIDVTIICNKCQKVKYCSDDCQQRDWLKKHSLDCDELRNQIQTPP